MVYDPLTRCQAAGLFGELKHTGHIELVDGSVRAVFDSMDLTVWRAWARATVEKSLGISESTAVTKIHVLKRIHERWMIDNDDSRL